jgi:hypothetical protein
MFNTLKLSRNKTIIYQGIDLNISYDTLFRLRSERNINSIDILNNIKNDLIKKKRKRSIKSLNDI